MTAEVGRPVAGGLREILVVLALALLGLLLASLAAFVPWYAADDRSAPPVVGVDSAPRARD